MRSDRPALTMAGRCESLIRRTRAARFAVDSRRMETASSAARSGELETRHVLRDGRLFAVLRTLDHGASVTVVAELVDDDGDAGGARRIRPFSFTQAAEASAFFAETLTSFAYLGCEIDQP